MSRFEWPVRVYYEDTDAGGVVFYANYLKFMERARTEWLRALGFEQDALIRDEGVLFAVRWLELDYVKPARFNERLSVSVEVVGRRGASLTFLQEVRRASDGETLCRGTVKVACLDAERLRPRSLPESLNRKLVHDL